MKSMFARGLGALLGLAFLFLCPVPAAEPAVNPPIKTAADGFPTGTETPEGVACDFVRASIQRDPALYLAVCLKPYGGEETKKTYGDFLGSVVAGMKPDAKKNGPSPDEVKSIEKCFVARPLGGGGPASYGYATFGFKDVRFVDVSANLQSGRTRVNRTLVIQEKSGQWAVHPRPDLSPLLSMGLSAEDRSMKDFAAASEAPAVAFVAPIVPVTKFNAPGRYAALTDIYRRITAEVETKGATNPRMQALHERFGRTAGVAVENKLGDLTGALLELSATDPDAKAIVDRYGIVRDPNNGRDAR